MKKNFKNTKVVKVTAAILAAMMLCGTFGTVNFAGEETWDNPLVEVDVWGTTISLYQYQIITIAYDDENWYKLSGHGSLWTEPLYITGKNPVEDIYAQANQYFGYIGNPEPETEYVEPTTEYIEPETTTPYVEPTTEYTEPTTEYVEPTTEYIPETEIYIEPETEYVEPVHVHNWVDSVKKQYVWVEGECTEAKTYSPIFNKQHWVKCGCGNYSVMVEDEFGNVYEDAEEAFDEHWFACGYNCWDVNIPIDIIGYKEKVHTGKKFNGTWELLDTMYCEECGCYLVIDTGEVLDELYTDYNETVSYKISKN